MKKTTLTTLLAATMLLGAGLAGCGDDADETPAGKCRALVSAACAKFKQCGDTTPTDQCMREGATELNCDKATSVGATYNQCLTDINALQCSASIALPKNCEKVITISG